MEWIIGGLVIWNIILTAEVGRAKRGALFLAIQLYRIAKGQKTWQDLIEELEKSNAFKRELRNFEIEELRSRPK